MRRIERSEILPIGEYEPLRERFRNRVIAEKRLRRVKLGEHMSAVFENRDSVMLQIQEMLRTERISSESGILHEIETYNDLIPGENQLSLTLFVEIPDKNLRDQMLTELAGLERCIYLDVDGESFEAKEGLVHGAREDRTTAVHYMKISLPEQAASRVRNKEASLTLSVRHPRYSAQSPLQGAALAQLAADLIA